MDALAAGLSPKLYRKNPFRLLGLPSHARRRSVKRRANALVGLIEAGDAEGLREEVIGGFTAAPDEPVLREASHRLEQPEERLLDEVFWFRADEDGSGGPLGGPDAWPMRDHVQRWIEEESFGPEETRVLATHNLAVFFHLIAVEIETKLCEEGVEELAREGLRDDAVSAWSATLDRWRKLAENPAFTAWLRERLDAAANGPFEDGDFDEIARVAREGAMAVMADIALDHARRDQRDEVVRLRQLVDARAESEVFARAAERLVHPRIERQMRVIEREKDALQDDKANAQAKVEALYAQLRPVVDEMALVLGTENRMVGDFSDALAEVVNQGVVATLLADEDAREFPTAQAALLRIRPMATKGELRDQIDRNLSAISCHFCRHNKCRPRDGSRDYEVKLFRINRVENAIGRVHFQTLTLNVPRCAQCRGSDQSALSYHEVREKLLEGWFVGAEPTDAATNAFVSSNGNPAPMHNIPNAPSAVWEQGSVPGTEGGSGGGLFSRISGLFGGATEGSGESPPAEPVVDDYRSALPTAETDALLGEHSFDSHGICARCGCSIKAIEKFGWGCS